LLDPVNGRSVTCAIFRRYRLILMTQPEASPPVPEEETLRLAPADGSTATAVSEAEAEAEPQPQPWTPERVLEWNAYYDIYVMLAVLLLAFVVSSVRVDENNPLLWTHLKTGELTAQQGLPVVSDSFSYSEPGARWINIPWLFQWSHAAIYKLVRDLVPGDPADPTANQASAEQLAIGGLIALNALVRLITAWVLLKVRRPGPGLWWSAICVAVAVGAVVGPAGVLPGGISGPGLVSPATWGMLLMAIEVLLLHRAYNEGRRWALYALIPLFLLWANVDESFFGGLLILIAAVVGRVLDGKSAGALAGDYAASTTDQRADGGASPAGSRTVRPATGLVVLALCVAVCLANPSTYRVFLAAMAPVLSLFGPAVEVFKFGEISYFGKQIQKQFPNDWYWFTIYYLIMVALALGSFLLNARRFAWSRFLPFALIAVFWGVFMGFRQEYAVVFAAVTALNGQEWYQDRFGTEGRLGFWPTVWSTGGRLVTLAVLFFCVGVAITGWRKSPDEPRFGFSYEASDFAFEAAEYLAQKQEIQGNIFNTTAAQGDALIWRAYPARRTFMDGRGFYSKGLLEEQRQLRLAIRDDDPAVWKPALDKYDISVVMIDLTGTNAALETYKRLTQSANWIPFYDDGRVVMFGRADAREPDLAAFKNNRLVPDVRAFRVSQPVPSADRPPTPTSWIDDIFRNRLLGRPQPHTNAAMRWLQGGTLEDNQPSIPDPGRCLLAIREARTALAKNPDDWLAYRLLDAAYRFLSQSETALLAGIPLDRQNQARISMLVPNIEILNTRFRQRVTALNYAIQTTPPPRSPEARRELQALNVELFRLFFQAGYLDLARDRLQKALDDSQPGDWSSPEAESQYRQQLDQLNQRVKQVEDNLMDLQVERQAGPIEKAVYARNQGAPGLAILELEEANRGNMSPMIVKPQLVDLYCNTGQPDRALELLSMGASEDPNLGTEPGASFMRQGQVYFLLGNYQSAASLWQERAIPRLRYDRSMRALSMAQVLGRGELIAATNTDLTLPTLVNRQAFWEFELALCLLESGTPDRAAEYFTRALKLVPDLSVRPIIVYYLEKIGKPVPELPKKTDQEQPGAKTAVDSLLRGTVPTTSPLALPRPAATPAAPTEPAKPANPKPAPKAEETKKKA
jgi:tetratricopeptide (TPR) repeat protein